MKVRAFLRAGTCVLALLLMPAGAAGHGGHGGGFPSSSGPKQGAPEPEDDETIESASWFGDYNNEHPDQVDHYLERVAAQREALRRAERTPAELAALDAKTSRLRLRKQIAEKRQQRDGLKTKTSGERVRALEREIHALKARFKSAANNGRPAPTASDHAAAHDEHDD